MPITINLRDPLSRYAGKKKLEIEWASGKTLKDLIDLLSQRYSPQFKSELLDSEGNLEYSYRVFINGQAASGLATPIQDGAEVHILAAMGGG